MAVKLLIFVLTLALLFLDSSAQYPNRLFDWDTYNELKNIYNRPSPQAESRPSKRVQPRISTACQFGNLSSYCEPIGVTPRPENKPKPKRIISDFDLLGFLRALSRDEYFERETYLAEFEDKTEN